MSVSFRCECRVQLRPRHRRRPAFPHGNSRRRIAEPRRRHGIHARCKGECHHGNARITRAGDIEDLTVVADGDIRRRPICEKERHAVRPARDEHAVRREPCEELTPRRMDVRCRTELAPECRRELRVVLLDVADARLAEDVIARIHDARNPRRTCRINHRTAHARRHRTRPIV